MEDNYVIPANSKKSILMLGFFTSLDLAIFLIGVGFSLILLMMVDTSSLPAMIMIITPALLSAFLVMPVPYYHNILQLIRNIVNFLLGRRRYYWKGWCVTSEE